MASFYYPEGTPGPVCDAIDQGALDGGQCPIGYHRVNGVCVPIGGPTGGGHPEIIDGPYTPWLPGPWYGGMICERNDITGELKNCQPYFGPTQPYIHGPYDYDYDGDPDPRIYPDDPVDFKLIPYPGDWDFNETFEIPPLKPYDCKPWDPDINIRPVTFYSRVGTSITRYAYAKSTPVTYAVTAVTGFETDTIEVYFSEDGLQLETEGEGSGSITLLYRWNDNPGMAGTAVGTITVGGQTITQTGRSGSARITLNVKKNGTYPISYTGLNAANTPLSGQVDAARKSICLKDGHNDDCNGTFTIEASQGGVPATVSHWNEMADRYAVWTNPAQCTHPCDEQMVEYEIDYPEDATYFFEIGADFEGQFFFDDEAVPFAYVGSNGTMANPALYNYARGPIVVSRVVTEGKHKLTAKVTNDAPGDVTLTDYYIDDASVDWGTITPGNGTAIRQDEDGFPGDYSCSAAFDSTGNNLIITGNGSGRVYMKLTWADNPGDAGVALNAFTVGGKTFTRGDGNFGGSYDGTVEKNFEVTVNGTATYPITWTDLNASNNPINVVSSTELCLLDGSNQDCNATITIENVILDVGGLNEVRGFITPEDSTTNKYLSFGTVTAGALVPTRTASITMDLTDVERLTFHMIAGTNTNGGERPDDATHNLEVNFGLGWFVLVGSRLWHPEMSIVEYQEKYGNWFEFNYNLPENQRVDNATIEFRSTGGTPSLNGTYNSLTPANFIATYGNCGDVYGLYKITTLTVSGKCDCSSDIWYVNPAVIAWDISQGGTVVTDSLANKGTWVQIGDPSSPASPWSDLMREKGIYRTKPDDSQVDPYIGTWQTHTATYTFGSSGTYDLRVESDNFARIKVTDPNGVDIVDKEILYDFGMGGEDFSLSITAGTYTIETQIQNKDRVDNCETYSNTALKWDKNPGGWYIKICRNAPCLVGEALDWVACEGRGFAAGASWGDFMDRYAIWPNGGWDTLVGTPQTIKFQISVLRNDTLTLEYAGDNQIEILWQGNQIVNATGVYGVSQTVNIAGVTPGQYELCMTVTNSPGSGSPPDNSWEGNPAGGAFLLKYSDNSIIRASTDLDQLADGNMIWNTRDAVGYGYRTDCELLTDVVSIYGTGFEGYLLFNDNSISRWEFITAIKNEYANATISSPGGMTSTYSAVATTIINAYINDISRYPEPSGFDYWMNRFKTFTYTDLDGLTDIIVWTYQNPVSAGGSGEQAANNAKGGVEGTYDNCDIKRV